MKGYRVYRDNTVIYPDLYYIWCYKPDKFNAYHDKITQKSLYKKHICGIGFYSRYHARHLIYNLLGTNKQGLRIVKGKRLISEGITNLPKKFSEHVFIKGKPKHIKRWIYPPEFRYDSHRRRHFIVYLVKTAETQGVRKFNIKYKRYFYGYRQSFPWNYYKRKENAIVSSVIQKVWASHGFRPEDFQ